ncbi:MAG: Hint domain-containing protein [Acidocella sp.]|nr:Hint domain-containing protein [Acidocella sp.]
MSWPADKSDFSDVWPLAVEVSGTGIWDRNVVTGEIRYSASWFRILGYEDVPQSNPIEIAYTRVHPEDLEYVKATMQAHFEGKTESYEVEHRLRCKDDSYKLVLSRGKVVSRDADGNALRMTGTTTDITTLRALEAKRGGEQASASLPERRRTAQRRRKLYAREEAPVFPQRRTQSIPCFTRGTAILTPRGLVAVEALAEGDAVLTVRENGPSERRVVWVGQRTFGTMASPLPERLRPVLIRADAFGPGVPERDLRLSPDHAIFAENHLIEASSLINGITVVRDAACRTVTYHHVALDAHDILLAENLPAESYLDCGGRTSFADFMLMPGVPILLRPDVAATVEAFGCAPLAEPGSNALLKVRALLDKHASRSDNAPTPIRSGRGALGPRREEPTWDEIDPGNGTGG